MSGGGGELGGTEGARMSWSSEDALVVGGCGDEVEGHSGATCVTRPTVNRNSKSYVGGSPVPSVGSSEVTKDLCKCRTRGAESVNQNVPSHFY